MKPLPIFLTILTVLGVLVGCTGLLSETGLIYSPMNGQGVRGIQTIQVQASEGTLVDYVDFSINSKWVYRDTVSPYSYEWDTLAMTNGWYTVSVELFSQLGEHQTDSIKLLVANDE